MLKMSEVWPDALRALTEYAEMKRYELLIKQREEWLTTEEEGELRAFGEMMRVALEAKGVLPPEFLPETQRALTALLNELHRRYDTPEHPP